MQNQPHMWFPLWFNPGQIYWPEKVDIELTVLMVKGIYMYRKDHTAESTTLTPWSKKVTPFPLPETAKFRHIRMVREVSKMLQLGNTFQFSAPPVTQTKPRNRATGKIRARWSNKARYNPMKTKRSNTPEISVINMDTWQTQTKWRCHFQLKCVKGLDHLVNFASSLFHIPYQKESDWTDEDWTEGHTKNTKSQQGRLIFYQTGSCPCTQI